MIIKTHITRLNRDEAGITRYGEVLHNSELPDLLGHVLAKGILAYEMFLGYASMNPAYQTEQQQVAMIIARHQAKVLDLMAEEIAFNLIDPSVERN